MSYTLELWAAPVDELAVRLGATGAGDPAGKQATPAQIETVVSWLEEAGRPIDSVQHSSAAGEWFEDDVIGGPIAGHLGADLAGHLLSRPLGGLTWDEFPSVGWARNAEIRAALTGQARDGLPDPDTDEGEVVRTVIDALARVVESGQDLVTYYG